jgi:hypothetical protein
MTQLSVLYVGNFTATDDYGACFNTECHYARAFEANDCKVTLAQEPLPYPDESQAAFSQRQYAFLDDLRDEIGKHDLLLYTRTASLPDDVIEVFRAFEKAGAVTAAVHLDLFFGLNREHELREQPMFQMQHVFTADGDHQSRFEAEGINHHWLRAGVVEDECYLGEYRPEFDVDVAFVGSGHGYHDEWPHRQELLAFLRAAYGDRFHKWGGPEERTIRGRELNDLYASAKVIVGDTLALHRNRSKYSSDRVYETLGRGGFLIMPRIGAMVKEIPLLPTFEFFDFGELKMHIDYWLENPEGRRALRDQLHAHVKEHCTYTQRARELLEVVGLR